MLRTSLGASGLFIVQYVEVVSDVLLSLLHYIRSKVFSRFRVITLKIRESSCFAKNAKLGTIFPLCFIHEQESFEVKLSCVCAGVVLRVLFLRPPAFLYRP
jgi:hypothetical protein